MNICIITSSYPRTPSESESAGVFVRDVALELARQENRVFVLTQRRSGVIQDDPELEIVRYNWFGKDKPFSNLNLINPLDALKIFSIIFQGRKALVDLIRREEIDYCLALWTVPGGYFAYYAKKRTGKPYAVWALGSDIWTYGRYPVAKLIIRKVLRHSSISFADGERLTSSVKQLSGGKCTFLPSTRLLPRKNLPEVSVDSNKINILFIGRYHKNKGIDTLLDAIALIEPYKLNGMQFHIFGGGPMEASLREQVVDLGIEQHVQINGFIDSFHAAAYLIACDGLVIPSRIESIPCVLSDALQLGTPVIVTDVGDMGSLVKQYNAGVVVMKEDPFALADALSLFDSQCSDKYKDGIEKLGKIFDLTDIVKTLADSMEGTVFLNPRYVRKQDEC